MLLIHNIETMFGIGHDRYTERCRRERPYPFWWFTLLRFCVCLQLRSVAVAGIPDKRLRIAKCFLLAGDEFDNRFIIAGATVAQ